MSILNPINDLVAWVIMHIYSVIGPIFGATSGVTWVVSIALLVVAMRLIMLPLFIKQMHTQRAMTALTPKITELRKKYKGDRETLNAETMKLYQEAGVNPLMGCLPVLLQMPLFFALFSVLRAIADAGPKVPLKFGLKASFVSSVGRADIFGVRIKDTFLHGHSVHVHVVVALVVLLSMGTTYLTVRQSMKRGMMPTGSDNPMGQSQKLMAYVMPLFALTGLYWPFGLVMYWVMTNLWTLGQQYVLLRKYPIGAAAAADGGNMPIGRSGSRPATALGLAGSSRPSRPKPASGKGGGNSAKDRVEDSRVEDAVPGRAEARAAGESGTTSNGQAKSARSGPGQRKTAAQPGAAPGSAANGGRAARGAKATGPAGSANGHGPSEESGGVLRRFTRSRPAPEPVAPVEPDTKIVRHQPQRQSRSKRSGKR